jgi:hypothetical protein
MRVMRMEGMLKEERGKEKEDQIFTNFCPTLIL